MNAPLNPPAFPIAWGGDLIPEHGMTLRDWFAGQIVAGLVASPFEHVARTAPMAARQAYLVADAMLAERAKAGAA